GFLLFALTAALGQLFFLAAQQLGLAVGLVLAALQLGVVDHRCGRRGLLGSGRFVALDEDALLAHLDLDGARLAGSIGLLDLAGGFARERDLLALTAAARAMRRAQEVEQAFLVRLGQRVFGRGLPHARRLHL